jgi:8-oxo-dGTP pyrophosphatase MutT (NUDIX family)
MYLMQRQGTGFGDGTWCLPCGHLEASESLAAGAARELREETGLLVAPNALRHCLTMHRCKPSEDTSRVSLFFRLERWEGEPQNAEPERCAATGWFQPTDPPTLFPMHAQAWKALQEGQTYLEVDWS